MRATQQGFLWRNQHRAVKRLSVGLLPLLLASILAVSCSDASGGRDAILPAEEDPATEPPAEEPAPETPAPGTGLPTGGDAPLPVPPPEPTDLLDTIETTPLEAAAAELLTKDSQEGENSCVKMTFTGKKAGAPVAGVTINFQISPPGEESGTVSPESAETNDLGVVEVSYCSGNAEGRYLVVAGYEAISANSSPVNVTAKPSYSLSFLRFESNIPMAAPVPGDEEVQTESSVKLNLIDSGPVDCSILTFQLLESGKPFAGQTVAFETAENPPKGLKLADKADVGARKTLPNLKEVPYIERLSDAQGEIDIPICAGVELGSTVVTGTFVDTEENNTFQALSPVIQVTAGLVNSANMSITFDEENARTLKGYFNTNSDMIHEFRVKLGARRDGDPIGDYPLTVAAETGKITVLNDGISKDGEDEVVFSMQALHMGEHYPYQDIWFDNTSAQTRCDPLGINTYANAVTAGDPVNNEYRDLARNWRSTVVYAIRGQEHFHDADRDGVFDVNQGDGFWDKDQDGYYTAGIDEITYDHGDAGFDRNSEWFIDMPTPFIDVDEDMAYNANIDILLGDTYLAPNGVRDVDTIIWKYVVVPIYMGTSTFAMRNSEIATGTFSGTTASSNLGTEYFGTYLPSVGFSFGAAPALWTGGADSFDLSTDAMELKSRQHYFFAQGVCGNPVMGGTEINGNVRQILAPRWGNRAVTTHFYVQPADTVREPSRRLLKEATGGSTAIVNFNVIDHPASDYSYPITFYTDLSICNNACTGATNGNGGLSCDGGVVEIGLTLDQQTINRTFSYAAATSCNCHPQATEVQGVCQCQDGYVLNGEACVLEGSL